MIKLYDAPLPPFQLTDIQIQHSCLFPPILFNVYMFFNASWHAMFCLLYFHLRLFRFAFSCVHIILKAEQSLHYTYLHTIY